MKAKIVKNGNVNIEPLRVNEYIEQEKQKALLRQEIRDELTPIIRNELTRELTPEIRKEVMLLIEQHHYLVPKKEKEVDSDYLINLVIADVSYSFNVMQYDVLGKSRKHPLPDVRAVISYICRTIHNMPYVKIAKVLNRNHGTLIHGKRQCENLMSTDKGFKLLVEQIIKTITDKLNVEN